MLVFKEGFNSIQGKEFASANFFIYCFAEIRIYFE
jgi:hypothetical protein